MVPYHDIQDFFYSGHLTTALILIYGYYQLSKQYPNVSFYRYVVYVIIFVKIPYIWLMMTWLRTHFIIDMTAAFPIAYLSTRSAEKVSYYADVLFLGLPVKNRKMTYFKPCIKCGWSNHDSLKIAISQEEKEAQAFVYNREAYIQKRLHFSTIAKSEVKKVADNGVASKSIEN